MLAFGCSDDDDSDSNGTDDTGPDDPPLSSIPFSTTPDWASQDVQNVSTGLAAVDINNDGWPDIVVSNGNDIHRQQLVVYYNQGDGTFPLQPDWQSDDRDYHGHLATGDVNGDGFIDVAVSVYLGAGGFDEPGQVKLYLNNGGVLQGTPSWRSSDSFYTFSLALGDVDNDGDPDLAVATGEEYFSHPEKNRIYFNQSGTLEANASWLSDSSDYAYDVAFGDLDNDGDLDLVFVESGGTAVVHTNHNGAIETTPSWRSTDGLLEGNSVTLGDINSDGFIDLALSDNYQLLGSGFFRVYLNNKGTLNSVADWTSADQGFSSGIFLADLDRDGRPDLVAGTWGEDNRIGTGHVRIYKNNQTPFNRNSDWTSDSKSVIEAITFADLNRDGLLSGTTTKTISPEDPVFYLGHCPVEAISRVQLNGQTLSNGQFCFDREHGWVSIDKNLLGAQTPCSVDFSYSKRPDLIVSNWDSNKGNYIFFNTSDQ